MDIKFVIAIDLIVTMHTNDSHRNLSVYFNDSIWDSWALELLKSLHKQWKKLSLPMFLLSLLYNDFLIAVSYFLSEMIFWN